jgi:tRNA (guanine-N7-)-methyltransferase
MTNDRPSRATEAFFGRRRGKTLRPSQQAAFEALLPRLRINISEPAPDALESLFENLVGEVRLEIGFGGGEHLLHRADSLPDTGFIGVEPFRNGMAKLLTELHTTARNNIRVYDDDATQLLDWLPDASLAGIDLLYPDPWPKKKHWKRRFVGNANLDRFARVLKPGGEFRFASDIDTYVNWTLLACRAHSAFEWVASSADDWRLAYPDWPGTRYEAKAVREGRTPAYLTFVRGS